MTAEPRRRALREPLWLQRLLIFVAFAVIGLLIVVPVVHVFAGALAGGLGAYWQSLVADADTRHSILLTFTVVPAAVAANVIFGVAAAWAVSRFDFPGRALLITLIDLPFSVSPVVAGLMFVLIFGLQGYLGPLLRRDGYAVVPYLLSALGAALLIAAFYLLRPSDPAGRSALWRLPAPAVLALGAAAFGALLAPQLALEVWPANTSLKIIFATPGLILATSFVTAPFVARELIPLMNAIGPDEELAAVSLGASGWQAFWHVTLPNIRWGLAYGIILCNARAMGEFGAVYVVSGRISGQTDTMPLRIEKLFQEYNTQGSFAVASALTLLAIATLIAKSWLERRTTPDPGAQAPR